MQRPAAHLRSLTLCVALGTLTVFSGCGSKEPPPQAQAPAAPAAGTEPPPAPVSAAEVTRTWTPEALEELLAPIALYPDPVLSQMLIASTNPQEVLDAGNWLLQNTELKGAALDDAAAAVGFTPPIRALVQFPQTVDMMCMELGWTTELGEAFVADQAGVLDATQRLRQQAIDVGNLQSSEQMKVETVEQEGEEVVVLKPAEPEVVYVPQYDPVAAYAPAPAAAPVTTTTTTTADTGHSTGALVATGVLAFGAGILVSELFEDDDDDWDNDYYYPNYGHGGMPYYPPYPYRPAYGGGYYPSNGYNRPPNYNSGFQNTGNVIINTGGGGGGGYWDRYDNKARPQTLQPSEQGEQPDLGSASEPARVERTQQASAAADAGGREAPLARCDRQQLEGPERLRRLQEEPRPDDVAGAHCERTAQVLEAGLDEGRDARSRESAAESAGQLFRCQGRPCQARGLRQAGTLDARRAAAQAAGRSRLRQARHEAGGQAAGRPSVRLRSPHPRVATGQPCPVARAASRKRPQASGASRACRRALAARVAAAAVVAVATRSRNVDRRE